VNPPRPTQPGHVDQPDLRIRRSWWILAGAFVGLGAIAVVRLLAPGAGPLEWLTVGLLVTAGVGGLVHRNAVAALEAGRRGEAESFARIVSGLSRSISPDAVVDAIVKELAVSTGSDHVVVVRRREDARALQATLVSARPGVPDSTTTLPIADLEDPIDPADLRRFVVGEPVGIPIETGEAVAVAAPGGPEPVALLRPLDAMPPLTSLPTVRADADATAALVAQRIASRVRAVYGLRDTISAPLTAERGVIGAIVLSRRVADPWSATTRRLLNGAAREASTALSRAHSHRAAEANASTDALTGLPNRRYFDEFCELLARRRRADDAVGVLMIDIDRFKVLNDTYGHAVGDDVLRAVAGAIVAAVREDDVPARFGGEEFVVLLRNPSRGMAIEVGERVRHTVSALDLREFGVESVSVSVGVAVASRPDQPIAELVADADAALYRAKRAGRDRVVAA
jgi:diguanylate cyclase (GGDEF)-like protein